MVPLARQPKDSFLHIVKSLAASIGGSAINAKWTSYGALEIDVFFSSRSDFELFTVTTQPLARIEFFRDLNESPKFKPKDEAIRTAVEFFNSERFWEAHEEIEGVWRVSSGEEKLLLQGLILVCTAYVHHQKGEGGVAVSVLRRARKQLDWSEPTYQGINLAGLRDRVDAILRGNQFEIFRL
jgi:hypothetical protein